MNSRRRKDHRWRLRLLRLLLHALSLYQFALGLFPTQHGDPGCQLVLVANKSDRAVDRVVTVEEGQACAEKYGAPYFEASAR